MPRRTLSDRDLRLLTAYLDGELPPGEARRVARRLAEDRAWGEAYAAMQAVKRGLHRLPREHAPRAFTLPAAAAPRRPTPAYRWASAAALLLLLLVFAGDFFTHNLALTAAPPPPNARSMQAPSGQPAAESAAVGEAEKPAASTARPRPLAVGPARSKEMTAAPPTPAPTATPTAASSPALPARPVASTPSRLAWRLAEGLLAFLTAALAFWGRRRSP